MFQNQSEIYFELTLIPVTILFQSCCHSLDHSPRDLNSKINTSTKKTYALIEINYLKHDKQMVAFIMVGGLLQPALTMMQSFEQ